LALFFCHPMRDLVQVNAKVNIGACHATTIDTLERNMHDN